MAWGGGMDLGGWDGKGWRLSDTADSCLDGAYAAAASRQAELATPAHKRLLPTSPPRPTPLSHNTAQEA